MSQIYFSNNLYQLGAYLGSNLFNNRTHLFAARKIIVPSDRYKDFLLHFFATHPSFTIAAGMQIVTLPKWLSTQTEKKFPSHIALEFRLFHQVKKLTLEPLYALPDDQLKMICRDLAHLFNKYGMHGEQFLKEWLRNTDWQQTLWRSIYEESGWEYPIQLFASHHQPVESLHLFGFSSLPSAHAQFFQKHQAKFYLFSPCRLFWADVLTAKETARKGLVNEDSSLLGSWGKWGRRLLYAISTEELECEEEYTDPLEDTTLGVLQKSLLDLEPIPKDVDDTIPLQETIKIFSATHRMREVEELLEEIKRILSERADLSPSDILVLAPDIRVYAPYIHTVFGGKESCIDYALHGLERATGSKTAQRVREIFTLIEEHFSLEALLQILLHRPWKEGEFEQIHRWLEKSCATWGFDGEQKRHFLKTETPQSESGTLQFVLDQLLFGLTTTDTGHAPLPLPLAGWTEAELLSTLIEIIETLAYDIAPAVQEQKQTLSAWIDWLLLLLEHHATNKDEDGWLEEGLRSLQSACKEWELPIYTWRDAKKICEDLFAKRTGSFQGSHLQAVHFDSLEEGRVLPKKVIALLGMQDGSFPRTGQDCAFDAMQPGAPSRGEIDRFLFLEAVLKAEAMLVISFLYLCPDKQIEAAPSIVIQEILAAMKSLRVQTLSEKKFDLKELQNTPYFSSSRFAQAKAYHHDAGSELSLKFFPEWQLETPLPLVELPDENVIDLDDLRLLLKDPIEFYFRKTLSLRLDWIDDGLVCQEEFFLKKRERQKLTKLRLERSSQEIWQEAHREKVVPSGLFGQINQQSIEKDVAELKTNLAMHNVSSKEIISRVIPPWDILIDGKQFTIQGTISQINPQGIIEMFPVKNKKQKLLQKWADLLVLKGHPALQETPAQLLFLSAKKDAVLTIGDLDPIAEMKKLLQYYHMAKTRLSPLLPSWTESLFDNDPLALEKEMAKDIHSRYVKWLFKRDGSPKAHVLCSTWSDYLREIFSSLSG